MTASGFFSSYDSVYLKICVVITLVNSLSRSSYKDIQIEKPTNNNNKKEQKISTPFSLNSEGKIIISEKSSKDGCPVAPESMRRKRRYNHMVLFLVWHKLHHFT